jgi:hypothetical protein
MNTEPTMPELDRILFQLRISLASMLTVLAVIRTLRPRGDALLPYLYTELETVQRAARWARAVLRRYLPPEGSAGR